MSIKGAAGTALQGQASIFEYILLKDLPPVSLSWQIHSLAQGATTLRGTTEESETSSDSGLPPTPHHIAPHPFQVS